MAKPVKILEVKGTDWMKGLSIQTDLALGGVFQSATNFDPFEKMGYLQPSLSPAQIDGTNITTQIDYIATQGDGNATGYAFAIGNKSGGGAKTFYRINLTTGIATDYSSEIDQNTGSSVTGRGVVYYGGRVIYRQTNSFRSNTFTPLAVNDTNLLSSGLTNSNLPVDFAVGPDGYLYYTAHANYSVGRIVTVTGTTSNTASAFLMETGMIPRSLTMDGRYLVVAADNNDGKISTVTPRCRVYFWDCVRTTAEVIWDIPDNYLIAARYVKGRVLVMGASGLWSLTANTPPTLVLPLTSTRLPSGCNAVAATKNILYWAAGAIGAQVYAYGSLIGNPVYFNPFQTSGSSDLHTAFAVAGTTFLAATDSPKLYQHNTGSTRASSSVLTAPNPLPQPYSFAFMKVTLRSPLSSGQTVGVACFNSAGNSILDSSSQSYSANGAKQTLIFNAKPNSTPINRFEDIAASVNPQGGAVVERIAVYGIPIDDYGQSI